MSNPEKKKTIKTSIGGQAVIEGVMMRGPKVTALSVRMPDQSISTEEWATPDGNKWYKKTPFIRGIFNFIESMTCGYQSLMKAAEKAGLDDDEEPSKFEQKLRDMLGDKFMPFLEGCILLFSLVMALFFFAFLPTTIVNLLNGVITHPLALSALEGLTKIAILIVYLAAISNMSDIKRVFMYHGAEHKTIFCYEHGEELTVENVRKYKRFHPRCGTSRSSLRRKRTSRWKCRLSAKRPLWCMRRSSNPDATRTTTRACSTRRSRRRPRQPRCWECSPACGYWTCARPPAARAASWQRLCKGGACW